MCPHDEFVDVLEKYGVKIVRCCKCGGLEVSVNGTVDADTLETLIEDARAANVG